MQNSYIPYILWTVIIAVGVASFWYYGRKKD